MSIPSYRIKERCWQFTSAGTCGKHSLKQSCYRNWDHQHPQKFLNIDNAFIFHGIFFSISWSSHNACSENLSNSVYAWTLWAQVIALCWLLANWPSN